jgi:hypothetical protein
MIGVFLKVFDQQNGGRSASGKKLKELRDSIRLQHEVIGDF